MSFYDFNINNNIINILPPDKRKTNNVTFIQSLLSGLQISHDSFFNIYYNNDLKERIQYNGSKVILEYALNKKFGGTFRQPPLLSDIFTIKLNPVTSGFHIGLTEAHTSSVGLTTSSDAIGRKYPFAYINNFQINIPTALYTSDSIIRDFVNKYVVFSINYTIVQV